MKRFFFLILTVLFISCDKNENEIAVDTFVVTTAGRSLDCKLIVIDFKESDLERIRKITDYNVLKYEALNLDENNFSDKGLILKVKVRKTFDSERFACTTLGISYPWMTVLEAELNE